MNQGNTYLVNELDPEKRIATVTSVNVDWTTRQRDFTCYTSGSLMLNFHSNVDPIEIHAIRQISGSPCCAFYGDICGIHNFRTG